jgi:hypothetical protein
VRRRRVAERPADPLAAFPPGLATFRVAQWKRAGESPEAAERRWRDARYAYAQREWGIRPLELLLVERRARLRQLGIEQ